MSQVNEPNLFPAAHASDGLQCKVGAEAGQVSVGPEGSHWAGPDPDGAQPPVSVPPGNCPAAVLTCPTGVCICQPQTHIDVLRVHVYRVNHMREGGSSWARQRNQSRPSRPPSLLTPVSLPLQQLLSWRGGVFSGSSKIRDMWICGIFTSLWRDLYSSVLRHSSYSSWDSLKPCAMKS